MTMTISISCDGCGLEEQNSTDHDAGTNEIDAVLEDGWTHSTGEDFCPDCSAKRDEDNQ